MTRTNTEQAVISRLQAFMIERHGGYSSRAPLVAIAALCDVGRWFLYRVVVGRKRMPLSLRERLESVLESIENGELRFRRVGQVWEAEYLTPPNPLPPPQDRMVPAGDFVEWARCRSCGGRHFTLVTLHGAPALWYLCDGCTWWETAGLGAKKPVVRRGRKQ